MTPARRCRDAAVPLPLLAALAAALLASGCGGDGGPDDPKPTDDTTPPTVALTDDVSGATATGAVTVTFTFSEDVGTSFTAADVTVAGGAKGAFAKVSATVYTLVATPAANAAGSLDVSVPAGAFADLAGNANAGPASTSQAYDTRGGNPDKTQMDLPVTFDVATVDYALLGFEGAEDSAIVADPADAANKVVRVNRAANAKAWAGTTLTKEGGAGFASRIPFDASNTRMTVRVWSPDAGIKVRLKAENRTDGTKSVETEATTTAASAWETLTFDFGTAAAGTAALVPTADYEKLTVFFHFGVDGATAGAKTYYFDDVKFIGGGGVVTPPATDFATVTFDAAGTTYTLTGFGGADDSAVVEDPTNASNKVARVNRAGDAQDWAGTTVSTGPNNTVGKLPFDAQNTRMTVRVWSPDAGIKVRLKVEDASAPPQTVFVESDATTTAAGAWETLTFDFGQPATAKALDLAKTYDRVSVFFNFGVTGAVGGAKTYYFDDVTFIGGGGLPAPPTAFTTVTFDAPDVTYTLTGFGGADDSTVVVDPADAANHVGRVVKSATAELWAGTTVSTGANQSVATLPFSATRTRMTVRVRSPAAGIQVRLKVEDAANNTHTCETEATVTTADAWQTLTFDFASPVAGTAALDLGYTYNKVSIFFDFGKTGAEAGGARTYDFDDVTFLP